MLKSAGAIAADANTDSGFAMSFRRPRKIKMEEFSFFFLKFWEGFYVLSAGLGLSEHSKRHSPTWCT